MIYYIVICHIVFMLNFNNMSTLLKKTQSSKGERLNWGKVQSVEKGTIPASSFSGRKLTESEHAKRNRDSKTLLVP